MTVKTVRMRKASSGRYLTTNLRMTKIQSNEYLVRASLHLL
jgi:hypothetical protein